MELDEEARPDATAALAGEGLETELGFATEELDELQDVLRTGEAGLRARLGERLAATASTLLLDYRAFAAKLEDEVIGFRERAGDVLRRIAP